MRGTKVWNPDFPKERKSLFLKIKTVPIIDEIKPDWSWLWEGLVELPNECWEWSGKTDIQTIRLTLRGLMGKIEKEVVCRTEGCCNPKHLVMA